MHTRNMKRRRGGAAKPPSNYERMLRRHIEAAGKNYQTVEELVDHLRSSYAHYARHKLRPFTKHVEAILDASSGRNDAVDESNDDGDTPVMKKPMKEQLTSSSVASASPSAGDDSSDEETLTSSEKFDLMKSMMREDLCRKSNKFGGGGEAKEEVELEINVDEKGVKGVNLMREKGRLGDGLRETNKGDRSGGGGGGDINGPMLKDLGGIDGVMKVVKKVLWPFLHPELPRHVGGEPTTGVLLKGPPGCGKTTLARAIANQARVPFYQISATELVSGVTGASEENIRELFRKAIKTAPSIVFIDEIDAIATKRDDSQRGLEQRIVAQLIKSMDESHMLVESVDKNVDSESSHCRPGFVLVIAATNRPDAIEAALRRDGRFDLEIFLGVPDEHSRAQILSKLMCKVRVDGAVDLVKIARSTPGFVGADLKALIKEATNIAMYRILDKREIECSKEHKEGDFCEDCLNPRLSYEELENTILTMADIEEAARVVQPSTKREGFSEIPNVKWEDIGGLHSLRQKFERYVIRPIKFPEHYEKFGLHARTGILLYGPPGCGKTLVAQAVANESGANFIYIKGSEILSKYVGESESEVKRIFNRARTCSPCILFFDEVDALTTKRGTEGAWIVERILDQLLINLDTKERNGVYVIGATNRPEAMDPAVLRRGRFGNHLYVPLPSPEERGMILQALARSMEIQVNADLMAIGKDNDCKNFCGADLLSLLNEAVFLALGDEPSSESCSTLLCVNDAHFYEALKEVSASITDEQIQHYSLLSKKFR